MVSVQRHLAVLRGALRPGEHEQGWYRAERTGVGHVGAVLLTDQRLLFSGLGFVGQSQEAWPLALVSAGEVRRTGRTALVELQVPGGSETFAGRPDDVRALAERLPASAAGPDESLTTALERLAALHDAGSLTDAEYSAAKARLLS